jgi:hypothetical protein
MNSKSNSVDISGTLTNSPVTVNQGQDGVHGISSRHVDYVLDEGSARILPRQPAKHMSTIYICTLCVSALGIIADVLGVLAHLGLEKGVSIIVLIPASLLVAFISNHDRWLMALGEGAHFKNGFWYEKLPDGDFVSYVKHAKCIYPKCEGLVHVVPAPPRERPNHSLVGKCSIGGVRHTYTVDYNGIGYTREFDWRPLPEEES